MRGEADKTGDDTGAADGGVFRIAIAMSGAISAGAYTAGVLDFLLKAIAEWNLNRPCGAHEVRLVSFAGASAGGITAAISTVAMAYGLETELRSDGLTGLKLHAMPRENGKGSVQCVMPRLYHAWVIRPRMVATDGPSLLSTEDIGDAGHVRSILNWQALDRIRDEALAPDPAPPAVATRPPGICLADPFHVYLTISNLRGIPYVVGSGTDQYRMLDHGDRVHFKVTGLGGKASVTSRWAATDQAYTIDAKDLVCSSGKSTGWLDIGDAALATAAFPGGLSARTLRANVDDFTNRKWPAVVGQGAPIEPTFPSGFPVPETDFGFVNVDGGMINNDPFEFARYTLLENPADPLAQNKRRGDEADRAVIMISPFPEGVEFDVNDTLDMRLLSVVKRLLPTLMQQVRFKPSELAAAADKDIKSRWIIAPRGDTPNGPASSSNIACGLLGGFGGFLDQSFREHDFQLGRRNCQKFLMDGLLLDQTNELMNLPPSRTDGQCQVVPLLGSALDEVKALEWPTMTRADFHTLIGKIRVRLNLVVDTLLAEQIRSPFWRCLAIAVWWCHRSDVFASIRGTILKELIGRAQIESGIPNDLHGVGRPLVPKDIPPEIRAVIAATADPEWLLRTPSGLARSTQLPLETVKKALAFAQDIPARSTYRVCKTSFRQRGEGTYVLYDQKPNPVYTLPVLGLVTRWLMRKKVG